VGPGRQHLTLPVMIS